MIRLRRTHIVATGLIACVTVTGGAAQSEKVSVRMAPQPGQSVPMSLRRRTDHCRA